MKKLYPGHARPNLPTLASLPTRAHPPTHPWQAQVCLLVFVMSSPRGTYNGSFSHSNVFY